MFGLLMCLQRDCATSSNFSACTQLEPSSEPAPPSPVAWNFIYDGRVIDDQSRLLIWVPSDLRWAHLHPRVIFSISTIHFVQLII
jgi:hypothetical protein